jgi:hypothetical protein
MNQPNSTTQTRSYIAPSLVVTGVLLLGSIGFNYGSHVLELARQGRPEHSATLRGSTDTWKTTPQIQTRIANELVGTTGLIPRSAAQTIGDILDRDSDGTITESEMNARYAKAHATMKRKF